MYLECKGQFIYFLFVLICYACYISFIKNKFCNNQLFQTFDTDDNSDLDLWM